MPARRRVAVLGEMKELGIYSENLHRAIAQKIFKFKVNYRLIGAFILFTIGVVTINYFSKTMHFHMLSTNNWYVNFSIMCAACGIWAFVTGMISIKAIFGFFKF